jgi:hypothetical protein
MAEFSKPADVNKIWSSSGQRRTPSDSKIALGFVKEIPKFQDVNYLLGRIDEFNAHINQMGIPVWDDVTEYREDKSIVQGSDGNIYSALQTHTDVDPTTDTDFSHWEPVITRTLKNRPTVDVTPLNSWSIGSGGYFKSKLDNGVLTLNIKLQSGSTGNGTVIGTLSSDYMPVSLDHHLPAMYTSDGVTWSSCAIIVEDNGNISILGVGANNRLICNASVIV